MTQQEFEAKMLKKPGDTSSSAELQNAQKEAYIYSKVCCLTAMERTDHDSFKIDGQLSVSVTTRLQVASRTRAAQAHGSQTSSESRRQHCP